MSPSLREGRRLTDGEGWGLPARAASSCVASEPAVASLIMGQIDQPENLKALTGLRFVAALLVFVSHTFVWFPDIDDQQVPLGWAGVGFFYVLSGFILTWVYAPRLGNFTTGDFYRRRFARIWPLHLVTMLMVIFFIKGFGDFTAQSNNWAKFLAHVLLMQAWVPNTKWVFSINAPAWSLSVEAFFYLLFPLLIRGGTKWLLRTLIGVVLITAITIVAVDLYGGPMLPVNREALICASPFLRLFDFIIGMLCGLFYFKNQGADRVFNFTVPKQLLSIGLCAAYFSLVMFLVGDASTDCNALLMWLRSTGAAPLFAFLIYTFTNSSGILGGFLASRPLIYLGEISFAFYLIHQSILLSLQRLPLAESQFAGYFMAAGGLLLSLVAAMVLHHLIEMPARGALIKARQTRSFGSIAQGFLRSFGQLFQWRRSFAIVAMMGVGCWLVQEGRLTGFSQTAIEKVIQESAEEFRGVRFDQDALLLGVTTEELNSGMYRIRMAWDLKENRRQTRFMHICNEKGKILKVGDSNRALFSRFVGNERVIDTVTLPAKKLKGAAYVAIGFFEPQKKQAPIFINEKKIQATRLKVLDLR